MAPFDLNYTSDELLRGATLPERLVFRPRENATAAPIVNFLPPVQATPARKAIPEARTYLPIDGVVRMHTMPQSIGDTTEQGTSTQGHIEYVLQKLDKNAVLTSVIFIVCYAGLLHAL